MLFKILGILIFCLIFFGIYQIATTRNHSPSDVATYIGPGLEIEVYYCKPFKKGRQIFGDDAQTALQPYGTYWRMGANEATEISFGQDVLFGGQAVAAGRYRMYAIPNKSTWEIGLNTELGKWGFFEPNTVLDVLKVTVPAEDLEIPVEQFLITFEGDGNKTEMVLQWDLVRVRVPIEASANP